MCGACVSWEYLRARAGCGICEVIWLTLVDSVGVVRGRCVAHEVVVGWMVRGVRAVCGLVSGFAGCQGGLLCGCLQRRKLRSQVRFLVFLG